MIKIHIELLGPLYSSKTVDWNPFEMRCFREMLKILLAETITNEKVPKDKIKKKTTEMLFNAEAIGR